MRKTRRSITELKDAELAFSKSLKTLESYILEPLKAKSKQKLSDMIPCKAIKKISMATTELYTLLSMTLRDFNIDSTIAPHLRGYFKNYEIFYEYMSKHEILMKIFNIGDSNMSNSSSSYTLIDIKDNISQTNISTIIKEYSENEVEPMESILFKPIQHLPRLRLILLDLIKHCPRIKREESEANRREYENTLALVDQYLTKINSYTEKALSARKIDEILKTVSGIESCSLNPTDIFIDEYILEVFYTQYNASILHEPAMDSHFVRIDKKPVYSRMRVVVFSSLILFFAEKEHFSGLKDKLGKTIKKQKAKLNKEEYSIYDTSYGYGDNSRVSTSSSGSVTPRHTLGKFVKNKEKLRSSNSPKMKPSGIQRPTLYGFLNVCSMRIIRPGVVDNPLTLQLIDNNRLVFIYCKDEGNIKSFANTLEELTVRILITGASLQYGRRG